MSLIRQKKKLTLLFVLVGILLLQSQGFLVETESQDVPVGLNKISKVIDGDTVAIETEGKDIIVRLIGLNTPETVDPRRPVECFGKQASDRAKEILNNKNVRLETDSSQGEVDKYGRLLRYVFLEDGTNFNLMMIKDGYGYEYTYDLPYKYQTDFKEAERIARIEKRGLWADGVCE